MKRLISLILAVALLLSLAPAVFADGGEDGGVALVFGTATLEEQQVFNSTEKVKYYAIPVSVKNTTSATVTLSAVQCYFDYDASSFEPANIRKDKYDYTTVVSFEEPLSRWSGTVNGANGRISVPTTTDDENYYVEVAANGEEKLFTLNLMRKSNIENGNYSITFSAPFLNEDNQRMENKMGLDKSDVHISYSQSGGNLNLTDKGTISIIDGALPTLDSVSMKADDEGGLDAVYGQTKHYTLTALSTKGKDISGNVTWSVSPSTTGITIIDNKLTVSSVDAGEYTVTATPNEGECQGNAATATFKVTPATITNPTVTITGFGKGQPVTDAKATAANMTVACGWYTGEGTPGEDNVATGKFAANSPYTLTLILTPNKNYKLADNTTVTVEGLDSQKTASLTIHENSGVAIVTATTGAKDATKRASGTNLFADSSRYGNTLSSVNLTAEANKDGYLVVAYVDGKETTTKVPGKFEWKNPAEKVGNVGNNSHTVVFTPDKPFDELYVGFEAQVNVRVDKKVLNLDETKLIWSETNLPYTGEEQTVTATPTADIAEYVNVTYDNETEGHTNTAINAGSYTAAAVVTPKDANNISLGGATAEDQNSRTITKSWTINKADLTAADKIVEVRYGTGSKDLTLADLGLSALANEPGVDVSFDTTNKGNVISIVGTQRDTDNKITGISITLQNTTDQNIGNEGSVTLTITSDNYETKTLTVTVKIVNKNSKPLTITGPASFPYGTTAETIKNALTVTGLPTGYDASKVTYTFSNSNISAATPGDYTLTVSYEDDNTIYTGTFNFKITKLNLAKATIEADGTLTYTGSEQTQNVTVKYNGTTIGASNYTVTNNKRTDAGTQTLTVTANADSTLYTGSKTFEFTIAKATPTVDDFTVDVPTGVVYDGNAHFASLESKANDAIGNVTVLHNGAAALPKDAGEYTVTLDVAASDNYNAATGLTKPAWKFTIAKATPTLEIETAADATYTGQPYDETSKITLTSASTVTPDTYLYFSDADCKNEASPVNVGTYWVKAKFNGDTNHNAVTSTAKQFKITKASYSLAIEAASVEYNKTPYSSSNIKVTPNLSVHFGYYADKALTKSIDAPTEVGTYYVRAFYEGDANHNHAYSNTASFEIKKATPATPPEIKVDNTDTTLGELGNKMLVGIGVPGTIYWYGPDGKPITDPHTKIEANTEYTWKFIPADPNNYNSIEGTTTPYVRDDLSWLPGVLGGGSSFSFHDVTRFDYYYDSVKWAADNGIASGTSRFAFSPDAVCTRAQTVTFLWRAAGSPLPRYRVSPFTDVHSYDYYYEAVLWAVEQGITTGLTATTFGPDETVTRGQVATFLYRAASAAKPNTFNPFTDVKPTAYNYGAILWAYDNRITTGTSTTTFSPDAFCTRAQIVTFLYRYYQGR